MNHKLIQELQYASEQLCVLLITYQYCEAERSTINAAHEVMQRALVELTKESRRGRKMESDIQEIYPHGINSTMITSCCGVAICRDERKCPRCGNLVVGHDAKSDEERQRIRWDRATRNWKRNKDGRESRPK